MARRFASLIVTAAALVLLPKASCKSGAEVQPYMGEDPRVSNGRATFRNWAIIDSTNNTIVGVPHECTTAFVPNRNLFSEVLVDDNKEELLRGTHVSSDFEILGSFDAEDAGLCAAMCATSGKALKDNLATTGPGYQLPYVVGQYRQQSGFGPLPANSPEILDWLRAERDDAGYAADKRFDSLLDGEYIVSKALDGDAFHGKSGCEAWTFCDPMVTFEVDWSPGMAPLRRTDPSDIAFVPRPGNQGYSSLYDRPSPDPNEPCLGEVVVRNGRVYAQPYWYDNPNAPNLCVQKRKDARCFNPDRSRSVSAGECTLYSNVSLPSTSTTSTFAGPPPVDERGWGSLLQHAGDASSLDDFDWWRKDGGNWTKHNTLFADDPDTGLPPLAEDGDGDVPWMGPNYTSNDPWFVGETNGVKPWPGTFMSGVCAWTLGVDV